MKAGPAVHRLHDGSALVARRIGRAFVPEGSPLAAIIRCGAALWLSGPTLALLHQSPLWLAGGSCAWCVAAWRAESEEEQPEPDAPVPAGPAHSDAEIYEGIVDYLRRLVADRNGVHLNEALNGLQAQAHLGVVVSVAEFGRQLQRRGIPVRASLKVAGSVGPGVHRDDLPAVAKPLPDTTFVAVG